MSNPRKKLSPEERQALAEKLDADLDRFMEDLAAKREGNRSEQKKPFDFEEWCREIDQHPAFMTKFNQSGLQNGELSEAVQAIQALKYDEDDPVECAVQHKEEGNRYFAQKKYRWAVEAYTKGIRLCCVDRQLNSVLYANRAAAHKHLGNLRSAIKDCIFARKFHPENAKVILRGAECFLELGQAVNCIQWIESSQTGGFDEKQKAKLEEIKAKAQKERVREERDGRKDRAKMNVETRNHEKLLAAIRKRGIKLRPKIDDLDDIFTLEVPLGHLDKTASMRLDEETGQLVWPLLLQYPQSAQTDFIAECAEQCPLEEVLEEVFASPAEWDIEQKFRFGNLRFFVPLDKADADEEQIREISPKEHSLGNVLGWPDVTVNRGLPVIQVYTRDYIEERLVPMIEVEKIFRFKN